MDSFTISVVISTIPAFIAHSKGRSFILWWIYSGLLFFAALPHALIIKTNQKAVENKMLSEGMKKCLYCAEWIKDAARLCRYCGREL